MELKLSCICCGGTDFKETIINNLTIISGIEYLRNLDIEDNRVVCNNCGLEDYIKNLEIKIC